MAFQQFIFSLKKAIENYPSIRKLSQWAIKWMQSDLPFNQRIIAFACVEGILFSGPFCAIFWYNYARYEKENRHCRHEWGS